jgi:hypothetical protein
MEKIFFYCIPNYIKVPIYEIIGGKKCSIILFPHYEMNVSLISEMDIVEREIININIRISYK